MRWSDVTKNPNSGAALEYRRATLNAALRPPVTDREAHLSALCVGRRVLDIGVADHDWTDKTKSFALHRRIAGSAADCLGVDILDDAVVALKAEGYAAITADVCAPDFSEIVGGTWDLIVAGEVIEHLGNPEAMMANFRRLLASGGRVVLTTPNPYCLRLVAANWRGQVIENVDHLVYWFPAGIAELAERSGFRLASYRGVLSSTTGSLVRRTLSKLASRTVLVPEASCWTMIYELEKLEP